MSDGYTKLFSGIVTSTVWTYDSDTKVVWVTMLALADKDGHVVGTIPGIARLAGVSLDAARKAVGIFLAPDPDSGSKEFDGRRIEAIDRGWRLLNHAKYRALRSREEKLEADRERIAAKRAAEKSSIVAGMSQVSHSVAEVAQAEASADPEADQAPPAPAIHGGTWSAYDWYQRFARLWGEKYGRFYGQGEGDSKAIAALGDFLASMPLDERTAAQLLSTEMLAEYLDDASPGRVKARHPWKWFVEGFNGFRAPKVRVAANGANAPPSDYCEWHAKGNREKPSFKPGKTCPECRHIKARNGTRESEPAPLPDWMGKLADWEKGKAT